MIKLTVLTSLDHESIGDFNFQLNSITIGSAFYSDLRIFDESVSNTIIIKIIENDKAQLIYNNDNGFHANGKKFKNSKIIKINEEIKINNFSFKLVEIKISEQLISNLKEYKKELFKNIKNQDPTTLELLSALEEDLYTLGEV